MVDDAQNQLNSLLNSSLTQKKIEIYLHQNEGFLATLSSKLPLNWKIGVYVLKDEELNDLNFYNNFDEVLFMTVSIGFQGGEFDTRVLSKVDRLRSLGYNGKVSVDGGVNLETAKLLRGHNIDRVSVGNYFKKSRNVEYDYEELYQALNE
jgi:pentose-5-phosphate-3-epimerase